VQKFFHDPKLVQTCAKLVNPMPDKVKIILRSVTGHIKYCVYVFSIAIFLP